MYHHDRLRECFEEHLVETEGQIERLNECFSPVSPVIDGMGDDNDWTGVGMGCTMMALIAAAP